MADSNEIAALKASMRGVMNSLQDLRPLAERVDALDPSIEVTDPDLDDLQRLSASHAVASEALRGLVRTMLKRRGKLSETSAIKTDGEE